MCYYGAEFGLWQERVQDFGVDVRVRRGQVAFYHPVAPDADHTGCFVFRGCEGDVWVQVGKAWVGGTPGEFVSEAGVVALVGCCVVRCCRAVGGGWGKLVLGGGEGCARSEGDGGVMLAEGVD